MRNCIRQKTVSLLLSALVLAWGIVPPGVEHSHAGGSDTTHRCQERREVVQQGSHDHDSDGQHCESEILSLVPRLADVVRHLHWQFFGMEFSLPTPGQPAGQGDDESNTPPAIVRVVIEGVPAIHAGPSFARVLLFGICEPSFDLISNLRPIPHAQNLVTSMPLCDRARHERSGVQLA